MKKLLITLMTVISFNPLFPQSGNVKDVRQTYLWDVTLSMQGKAPGAPDIWEPVKEALISDIQQIRDDRTEIVVIPFQHKALEEWREPATAEGKARLVTKIKAYKIPLHNYNGKMTTITCLYEPLLHVVNKVLSADKVDILKLMTDGIPDEHENEYKDLLARWCQIAKEKDAYGFYIMLTDQAKKGHMILKEINPCRFDAIDVTQLNGTNVSIMMLTPQQNITYNVRENYGNDITIKYDYNGSNTLQEGYKIHVYSHENAYIHIDEIVTLNSDFTITVKAQNLMSQTEMMNTLSHEENEKLFLYSEPAEGMDKLPYAMTRILNAPTTMEMINKPEKTVKFHVL